ncbi:MAG: DUF4149 domain-containing protein [Polyangiaceae bacterium]
MSLRIARALFVLAACTWIGGLVVLGAVVAPLVFRIVPAPASADAMIAVFQRFERIALAMAVILAGAESVFAFRAKAQPRIDLGRRLAIGAATLLLVWESVSLAPSIAVLHKNGAVRGFGKGGMALESAHVAAERVARAEVGGLLLALVLFAVRPPLTDPTLAKATRGLRTGSGSQPPPSSRGTVSGNPPSRRPSA